MKLHKTKFNEIKKLLKEKLGEEVIEYEENGTEIIEIKNTEFWLTIDENEFTVGYGSNHTHFSEDYGNLFEGIIQAFDLLTNKVKITNFIKGNTIFKTIIEIEYPNSKLINIGETSIIFYPFWKKTKITNSFSNPIMNKKEIEREVNEIIN
ncbi:hypothetical protein BN1195_02988 [Chryseobacterium oranimense G311]|uniref:hypothetical protein n=1 Tax=Chryseobacterium oranimense TaxID=421058 RepID=UPI0005337981|nr:hypothetical protein [Chryseobacterium oranimense]CEJ70660.1 hypothetical protein BN1195_02988 [Chryseobacterium oranimense G311]